LIEVAARFQHTHDSELLELNCAVATTASIHNIGQSRDYCNPSAIAMPFPTDFFEHDRIDVAQLRDICNRAALPDAKRAECWRILLHTHLQTASDLGFERDWLRTQQDAQRKQYRIFLEEVTTKPAADPEGTAATTVPSQHARVEPQITADGGSALPTAAAPVKASPVAEVEVQQLADTAMDGSSKYASLLQSTDSDSASTSSLFSQAASPLTSESIHTDSRTHAQVPSESCAASLPRQAVMDDPLSVVAASTGARSKWLQWHKDEELRHEIEKV
jgi:hypothetical protein